MSVCGERGGMCIDSSIRDLIFISCLVVLLFLGFAFELSFTFMKPCANELRVFGNHNFEVPVDISLTELTYQPLAPTQYHCWYMPHLMDRGPGRTSLSIVFG